MRTVPVPGWCKGLLDAWLSASGVTEGKVFRSLRKNGRRQEPGVTVNVVWDVVLSVATWLSVGGSPIRGNESLAKAQGVIPADFESPEGLRKSLRNKRNRP